MEITKDIRDKIVSYYHHAKEDNEIELEDIVRQGKKLGKTQFSTLLQYFRSIHLPFKFHEESLSINFKYKNIPYRFEINGTKDIGKYCKSNNITGLSNVSLMSKSWVKDKFPIIVDDYDMKINLKVEHLIDFNDDKDLVNEIKKNLYSVRKYFRFRKRFSFFSEDGLFRYDLTIVKSSNQKDGKYSHSVETGHLNLISSGIFQNDDEFEVEIEFIRPQGSWPTDDVFVKGLLTKHALVLSVLDEDDHVVSSITKRHVLDNYYKLCNINMQNKYQQKFVGPMPITLELKNLTKPDLGVNSILQDYTVTDKADGERHLMFINTDGKVYIINNRFFIRYTGIYNDSLKNTLLDGEYITRTRSGRHTKLFMVFDIFFYKGKNVSDLPLWGDTDGIDSRIKYMNMVTTTKFSGDASFKIESKTFLEGDILKASRTIYESFEIGNMRYKIDGLIYTPKYNPIGGVYKDSKPQLGGTWIKVFKWKPHEDNSIDFLIETEKNSVGSDIVDNNSKIVKLFVGYDINMTEKITPRKFLLKEFKYVDKGNSYHKRLFQPPGELFDNLSRAYIELDDNNVMKAENGDIIYDGDVVEFAFKNGKWQPLRVRRDKTRGNDYFTAINIWRSIQNPVTKTMITGQETLNIDENEGIDDDMYYNRQENRENSATKSMLDFHNHWVKNTSMVAKFQGKASSVFDIACGKGNDIIKYTNAKFKTIVGVDKSEDNIVNPIDGAYARLMPGPKNNFRPAPKETIIYLPMDCSKLLDTSYINNIADDDTKSIAELLWGIKNISSLEKYHGIAKRKFDMVACQFAIHYFFVNSATLETLLINIDSVLKDGGYFMGTCLDGGIVDYKFRKDNIGKGQSIRRVVDNSDRVLWNIKKDYDKFHSDSSKNFGLQIEVYMETINKRIKEYLVDFNVLKARLAKYNIHPLTQSECDEMNVSSSSGTFKDLYEQMETSGQTNRFVDSAKKMTQAEKDYSFMNRWFIFKKSTKMT